MSKNVIEAPLQKVWIYANIKKNFIVKLQTLKKVKH